MSNPAVITLDNTSSKKGTFKRFAIEDNIGESIHLHIDNMRVDFTIEEFLELSRIVRESLKELDFIGEFSIENFDEHFLKECMLFLPKLNKIKIEEVELSKLKCIVNSNYRRNLNFIKLVSILDTPAYKYLKGETNEFLNYRQFNYFGIDNKKKLLETLDSIKENNYPYKEKYIILFNGQNIVRDGQHRAAVLAHLYGIDARIKVMMFHFDGNRHVFKKNTNNFKFLAKWTLKKVRSKLTGMVLR